MWLSTNRSGNLTRRNRKRFIFPLFAAKLFPPVIAPTFSLSEVFHFFFYSFRLFFSYLLFFLHHFFLCLAWFLPFSQLVSGFFHIFFFFFIRQDIGFQLYSRRLFLLFLFLPILLSLILSSSAFLSFNWPIMDLFNW